MAENTKEFDNYIESKAGTNIGALYEKANTSEKKKKLLEIEATGQIFSMSDQHVEEVMRDVITNTGDQSKEYLQKKLICKNYGMPEKALNSKLTVKELVKLRGSLQWAGLNEKEIDNIMQDPLTYERIRLRGQSGKQAVEQIFVENFGKKLGLPESAYGHGRMSIHDLDNGVSALQQRGMEGLAGDEAFWRDYLKSPQKSIVFEKWKKIIDERKKAADAKREKELKKELELWRKAQLKKALEDWDKKGEKEQLEETVKKRKKKKRIAKIILPSIKDIRITETIRVATLWGDNYLLRIYPDGSQQLFAVDKRGTAKPVRMWKKFKWIVSERRDGMLLLIPAIGRKRRASPMDLLPGGSRGPAGMNQ